MEKLWSSGNTFKNKCYDAYDRLLKWNSGVKFKKVNCVGKEELKTLLDCYSENDTGLYVLIEETKRFLDIRQIDSHILKDLSVRIYSEFHSYELFSGEGRHSIVVNYVANKPSIIFKQAKDKSQKKDIDT